MAYYNWDKIVEKYSVSELKRIHREKYKEDAEKVKAVINELIKRGILSEDEKIIPELPIEAFIVNVAKIKKTKSNKKLSKSILIFLSALLVINLISVYSSYLQYNMVVSFDNGMSVTNEMITNNNIREIIISLLKLLASLGVITLFIIWVTTAYVNLHRRISKCDNTIGWAIAGWFVPFINLYEPYNIVKELTHKTKLLLVKREINFVEKKYFLGIWWIFCILAEIFNRNTIRMIFEPNDLEIFKYISILDIFSASINVILIIFTIILVKRFSVNEELLYQHESISANSFIQ